MKLEFRHRHLSTTNFPTVDVPPLTIIVGLNGSGKTHLLEAVLNGSVRNSVAPIQTRPGMPVSISLDGPVRLLSSQAVKVGPAMPPSDANPIGGTTYTTPAFEPPWQLAVGHPGLPSFSSMRLELLKRFVPELQGVLGCTIDDLVRPGEDVWQLDPNELSLRAGKPSVSEEVAAILKKAEQAFALPAFEDPAFQEAIRYSVRQFRSSQQSSAFLLCR